MNISYIPASVRVKERSKLLTWLKKEKKRKQDFQKNSTRVPASGLGQHTLPVVLVFGAWRRHLNKKIHLSVDSFQIEPLLQLS